jgi:hypothetical protein
MISCDPVSVEVSHPKPKGGYGPPLSPVVAESLRLAILNLVNAKAQLVEAQELLSKAHEMYASAILAYKQNVCESAGCEWPDK